MKQILINEDDNEFLDELILVLKYENYSILSATNGSEGIKLAFEHIPDLILCDILMRGMDGFEVLNLIKKNSDTSLIPFVFITAVAEREDIRKAMEMGADDYLVKPFTRGQLLKTIDTGLKRSSEGENQISQPGQSVIHPV